jgi:putative nucleotidyltransferase with HDIG domain
LFQHFEPALGSAFAGDALMDHSLEVAAGAKVIAASQSRDRDVINDAFVAGLLHDVGKLVLAAHTRGSYGELPAAARSAGLPVTTVENEQFGITHADVGAYLMDLWGLPASIVEAIAFHHAPDNAMTATFTPLTAVHVANALVHEHDDPTGEQTLNFSYLWKLKLLDRLDGWRPLVAAACEKGAAV